MTTIGTNALSLMKLSEDLMMQEIVLGSSSALFKIMTGNYSEEEKGIALYNHSAIIVSHTLYETAVSILGKDAMESIESELIEISESLEGIDGKG